MDTELLRTIEDLERHHLGFLNSHLPLHERIEMIWRDTPEVIDYKLTICDMEKRIDRLNETIKTLESRLDRICELAEL